jgi:hypothetical protein
MRAAADLKDEFRAGGAHGARVARWRPHESCAGGGSPRQRPRACRDPFRRRPARWRSRRAPVFCRRERRSSAEDRCTRSVSTALRPGAKSLPMTSFPTGMARRAAVLRGAVGRAAAGAAPTAAARRRGGDTPQPAVGGRQERGLAGRTSWLRGPAGKGCRPAITAAIERFRARVLEQALVRRHAPVQAASTGSGRQRTDPGGDGERA